MCVRVHACKISLVSLLCSSPAIPTHSGVFHRRRQKSWGDNSRFKNSVQQSYLFLSSYNDGSVLLHTHYFHSGVKVQAQTCIHAPMHAQKCLLQVVVICEDATWIYREADLIYSGMKFYSCCPDKQESPYIQYPPLQQCTYEGKNRGRMG